MSRVTEIKTWLTDSLTDLLTHWVTRSPIELSWTAKKVFLSTGAYVYRCLWGRDWAIADICPHRHHWRWCTFFKLVPFVAQRMRNLGLSWPILAILSGGVSKLTNIRYESEKDLKVPEGCDQASWFSPSLPLVELPRLQGPVSWSSSCCISCQNISRRNL